VPTCPEYRVRLFLSVDLVGSTAYKDGEGNSPDPRSPFPKWVEQTRLFYRDFPETLRHTFETQLIGANIGRDMPEPRVWKTLGDEIIFCTRLQDLRHLSICVIAFLRTLKSYGEKLEALGGHLDVKGAAWIATFPAPNVTVPVSGAHAPQGDQPDEALELEADENPSRFDFLGKNIDTGFRVSRYSSHERFAITVELAYLLSNASQQDTLPFNFSYHGRESMKGVIKGRPYPLLSIEADRNSSPGEVRLRERLLNRADSLPVWDFLQAFINQEGIERPILSGVRDASTTDVLPSLYIEFREAWEALVKENEQRSELEEQAAVAEDGGVVVDPDSLKAIEEAFNLMVSRVEGE
jgi:hypothetical protein